MCDRLTITDIFSIICHSFSQTDLFSLNRLQREPPPNHRNDIDVCSDFASCYYF